MPSSRIEPRVIAGSAFTLAVVIVSTIAAWPIYRSWSFVLVVAVGTGVGGLIAFVAWRRRWSAWSIAGALAVAFLVLGIPLAVPSRLGGPTELLRGLGELVAGAVFGWKDLVTVDLPVGSYRNLLVPAFILFLVGTCVMLLLSWRADRRAYIALPIAIGMLSFGLFFGRTQVSSPLPIGPIFLYAPLETALGVAAMVAILLWLAWRTHDSRVRALQSAAASSGVRVSRRPSSADRRRAVLGAGMAATAVVIAVAVVPFAARGADRDVLRSAIGPQIELSDAVSPLAQYRALFSDERADDVLFVVDAGGDVPDRVRIATLDDYDGEVFRAGGADAVDEGRFLRVPSTLDAGEGESIDVRFTIEGLDGLWMPTAGRLASVEFGGGRAASLSDGFYYSAEAAAGVETAGSGLEAGDTYRLRGVEPRAAALEQADAPGGTVTGVAPPESLRAWVEAHVSGSGGAALAELVDLLRERGYLSHGLPGEEGTTPVWVQGLGGEYDFQPSASGHSLGRIDTLFERLLEREADPRAEASGNYVAAVGDDEQFAVAAALIARELGFPSRVVVGARLSADEPGLATCEEGACRAQDLAAWAEVLSADGDWIAVDATPQYAQSPSLEVTEQRDPENVTEVRPDSVEEILPPDPVQQDSTPGDPGADDAGVDLAWLWSSLRITGLVLLVLLLAFGPFLGVIAAKAARRRARRTAATPAARIAGGWEEYADAAIDAGRTSPRAATRAEAARAFGTPSGPELAVEADRAVFAGPASGLTAADAEAYWETVEQERALLRDGRGFWRRVAATVSLKSIVQPLVSAPGTRTLFSERGRRRIPESVRPSP
ncbi:MAG: transglutaminase-like domain-containing protein [Microbacterium sp.]